MLLPPNLLCAVLICALPKAVTVLGDGLLSIIVVLPLVPLPLSNNDTLP
jgi:hypothetical protein